MDESSAEPDAESGGDLAAASIGTSVAIEVALDRKRRNARSDPQLDSFLKGQARLADLQAEHLHEQRDLILSRLRWGRFGDRMKALLQIMTALAGAAVVVLV